MIGQTISHYRILEKLGEGGMGVVYKAEDTKLDRLVALKFLPSNLLASDTEIARLQQEAKALSALNHPNIATVHDIDEENGQRFLVLEYIPGGTLKSKLKQLKSEDRELSITEVLDYGIQIAEGLAHAHREGIIHRDVKTDNVMLTKEGKIKITDFGLAILQGGGVQLTKAGSTVGTAAYMSPEQMQGGEVDNRSDLFSFGVVLYELTTSHMPFRGEHEAAVAYSIINEDPPTVTSQRQNAPQSLSQVITKCLAKDKSKRFQRAEEIASDLRKIQQETLSTIKIVTKRSKLPWLVVAALIALAAIAVYLFTPSLRSSSANSKTIAVLMFANMSGSPDDEYFSDGVTEDILTQLSKIADLHVISRTSVMQYKGTKKTIREIGKELNAGVILEGSIRRAGDQVRIVAQLIDANNDEHLWAESYDREMTKIFAIQSDVAQKIAAALKAKLLPAEKERIEKNPTTNIQAYNYYLKGREHYARYTKQDNDYAIQLFRKALELDSNYALAYSGLGDAYGQGTQKFGFSENWKDSSIAMSEKAIAINPNLAEAYKALALGYGEQGWYSKSFETIYKAVELNPNYYPAVANIGWINWLRGKFDDTIPWAKKATALSPTSSYNHFAIGMFYLSLGDDTNAEEWFRKALQFEPDYTYSHIGLSLMYQKEGKYSKAIQAAQKILSNAADNFFGLSAMGDAQLLSGNYEQAKYYYKKAVGSNPSERNFFTGKRNTTSLGYIYWQLGQKGQAQKMFNQSLKLDQKELDNNSESYDILYDFAAIHAAQGNKQEAYKWLQKAIDAGWPQYYLAEREPWFDNLRNDDQYKQIMANLKAKIDEMRRKVEEMDSKEKQ